MLFTLAITDYSPAIVWLSILTFWVQKPNPFTDRADSLFYRQLII